MDQFNNVKYFAAKFENSWVPANHVIFHIFYRKLPNLTDYVNNCAIVTITSLEPEYKPSPAMISD